MQLTRKSSRMLSESYRDPVPDRASAESSCAVGLATIHKAQGQTIPMVVLASWPKGRDGDVLEYVALSRVRAADNILVPSVETRPKRKLTTQRANSIAADTVLQNRCIHKKTECYKRRFQKNNLFCAFQF
jgi:superfamily I DNA/RNA helicase